MSTHLYVSCNFFPLSLITCQSGTDSLCDSFFGCMALTLVESVKTAQQQISSSHVLQLMNKHGKYVFSL